MEGMNKFRVKYIYKMSQYNSLYNHQIKISLFKKKKGQEGKTAGPRAGTMSSGEDIRKGCRRVNMVEILCIHVCKWKNGTILRMEKGAKGERWRG
jgi:hypothetical protein